MWFVQDFKADVMLAEIQNPCTALLAHVLDLPWVNHWPLAPIARDFDQRPSRITIKLLVSLAPHTSTSRVDEEHSVSSMINDGRPANAVCARVNTASRVLVFTFHLTTIIPTLIYYMKCHIRTTALALSALCYTTVLLREAEKLSGAPAYRLEGVADA